MSQNNTAQPSYQEVLRSLLPPSTPHYFLSLPTSPLKPSIPSSRITSLSLHPTLESALHILNRDLTSAHFLLRHMQNPPAYEAMMLHGILHRIEGDVDKNARAWYTNVADYAKDGKTEIWEALWGVNGVGGSGDGENGKGDDEGGDEPSRQQAMAFLDRIDAFRKTHFTPTMHLQFERGHIKDSKVEHEYRELKDMSLVEFEKVIQYCEKKFGTGSLSDASEIWVANRKTNHGDKANAMITGGEGWREF